MSRTRAPRWLGSGSLWMWVWLGVLAISVIWGGITFAVPTLRESVLNVAALSIFANILAAAGGVQAALTMRVADPKDPL